MSEALRELAADGAGHGRAARHADHGAGVAGDVPLAGFGVGRVAGVGFVELDVFLGDLTGRNGEGHIVVEEHLGLLLVGLLPGPFSTVVHEVERRPVVFTVLGFIALFVTTIVLLIVAGLTTVVASGSAVLAQDTPPSSTTTVPVTTSTLRPATLVSAAPRYSPR